MKRHKIWRIETFGEFDNVEKLFMETINGFVPIQIIAGQTENPRIIKKELAGEIFMHY